jgi:acetyltransferase
MVVFKVGSSERGKSASSSHTGKVSSSQDVYDAVFEETGVMAVDNIDAFVKLIETISQVETYPDGQIGVVTTSGGAGVHIADTAAELSITVPNLADETRNKIEGYIPDFGSALNPVDLTAQVVNSKEAFDECLRALFDDQNLDTVLLQITNASGEDAVEYAERVVDIAEDYEKPLFLSWTGGVDKEAAIERYREGNIPVFESPARCVKVINHLAKFKTARSRLRGAQELPARVPDTTDSERPDVVTEIEGKQLLAEYGIRTPEETLIREPQEIETAVGAVELPAVAKIISPDIQHRDRVNGVRTDLQDEATLEQACSELFSRASELSGDLTGVAIQEQVSGAGELALGINNDQDFGPVVMLGQGGVNIEDTADVTFRTVPVTRAQARAMLSEIELPTPLTEKQRTALIDSVKALSDLYRDNPWIEEGDVNPLIVTEDDVVAVDALFLSS